MGFFGGILGAFTTADIMLHIDRFGHILLLLALWKD